MRFVVLLMSAMILNCGCKAPAWQTILEDLFSQSVVKTGFQAGLCTAIGTFKSVAAAISGVPMWGSDAGGSPAASHFLLLAQKKVTKEKGTRCGAPSGFPKFPDAIGRLRNLRAEVGGESFGRSVARFGQSSPTSPDYIRKFRRHMTGISERKHYEFAFICHSRESGNPFFGVGVFGRLISRQFPF